MKRPVVYLGIDPGNSGAIALISKEKSEVISWNPQFLKVIDTIRRWQVIYDIKLAILEHAHAFPHQGVVSVFNYGLNYGCWQGILTTLGIRYKIIHPTKWKKFFWSGVKGKKSKGMSLDLARELFPDINLKFKKDHNKAEALLLAKYGELI